MSAEVVKYDDFTFHGDRIPVAVIGGEAAVYLPRVAQLIGRDPVTEWARLYRMDAYRSRMRETVDPITGARLQWLSRGALLHWLSSIYSDELAAPYRAKHTVWVNGLIDAIDAYVTKGVAVNRAVVGEAAAKQIEAIALQARAQYLGEVRGMCELALRECAADDQTARVARLAIKATVAGIAGDSAGDGNEGRLSSVGGIARRCGLRVPAEDMAALGKRVADEYRRRYKQDPPGRTEQEFGPKGQEIWPWCYASADWGWIEVMVRNWLARDAG